MTSYLSEGNDTKEISSKDFNYIFFSLMKYNEVSDNNPQVTTIYPIRLLVNKRVEEGRGKRGGAEKRGGGEVTYKFEFLLSSFHPVPSVNAAVALVLK